MAGIPARKANFLLFSSSMSTAFPSEQNTLVPVLFCRRPCGSLPKREPAMSIQLLGPGDGRTVRSLLEKKAHAPVRSQSTVLNPAGVVILRELDLICGRDF